MNLRARPVSSGTKLGHQNPSKDEKSSKRIGVNSFPKTFIISWLLKTTFVWEGLRIAL